MKATRAIVGMVRLLSNPDFSGVSGFSSIEIVGPFNTFNNLSPDGNLIRSTNGAAPYDNAPEVVTQIEADLDDATVLSFLEI